ncbi:MAG: recombinase family protein [Turicibacter sp.]|nr:recombinase family protein [Turicibacter sp.]
MRKITKITPTVPSLPTRKRVAAYARVSVEKGRTLHSLSAQVSYYSAFIQKHPEWEYVGVYADSGETGTGKNRGEFGRLIADCEAGKIDIIITKTISRFARNTVDLLETVRRLREIGVEVRFEEQNINSMSGDGELMMTILASFAQEESRSLSENVKWAIRKGFKEGRPNSFNVYGYRWNGEKFIVHPEEAEVIRIIYANFLDGLSAEQTAKQLTEMGKKSYTGLPEFPASAVRAILRNDKYTGDLRLQKTYIENHITHKEMVNNGELPIYLVEDAHEAIIDKETFNAVQAEVARRRELGVFANWSITTSALTSKIKCGKCGASFHRKGRKRADGTSNKYWRCATMDKKGNSECHMKDIPENKMYQAATEVLELDEFDETAFADEISLITVPSDYTLVFHLTDGSEIVKAWENTSKKDCWTPEARKAAGERMKKRTYSEEERKRRSERMTAYWAKRRSQEGRSEQ